MSALIEDLIDDLNKKGFYPIIPEEKVSHLRQSFSKRDTCTCGFKGLHKLPIQGYGNHSGGYYIGFSSFFWLFITCPKCGYGWSIPKLGCPRERY